MQNVSGVKLCKITLSMYLKKRTWELNRVSALSHFNALIMLEWENYGQLPSLPMFPLLSLCAIKKPMNDKTKFKHVKHKCKHLYT